MTTNERTWLDAAIEVAWNHIQKEINIIRGIRYCNEDGQYLATPVFDVVNFLSHNRFWGSGFCYNPSFSYKKNTITFNKFKELFLSVLERDRKEGYYGTKYYKEQEKHQKYNEKCSSCRWSVYKCSEEKQEKFIINRAYRVPQWKTLLCNDYERG